MLAALMAVYCDARCYLDVDPTNPGASLVSVPPFEFGPEVPHWPLLYGRFFSGSANVSACR